MTDDKVVSILKARPVMGPSGSRQTWQYGVCECQWFWLYSNGEIQSVNCDKEQVSIRTFMPGEKP